MTGKRAGHCEKALRWIALVNRELELRGQFHESGGKRSRKLMGDWRATALKLFEAFNREGPSIPWSELCDREIYLRNRILKGPFDDPQPEAKMLRAWWGAVETLMDVYQRELAKSGFAPTAAEARPVQIPFELAGILKNQFAYLAAGSIPALIKDVTKGQQGRRRKGPDERRDIGIAVAYIRACSPDGLEHAGRVVRITHDPRPVKTLAGWFSVEERTVQGWGHDEEPAFLGLGEINADNLVSRTQQAGRRYSAAGRSAKAIQGRARSERKQGV